MTLGSSLKAQDKELLSSHAALTTAQAAVAEKDSALHHIKGELWAEKQRATKLEARLESFAYELFSVSYGWA